MKLLDRPTDIFLSHSRLDDALAGVVRNAFETAGLSVFGSSAIGHGSSFGDAIRNAIAESRAFVAILTTSWVHSPSFSLELGAAWGCDKPVFLLLEGLSLEQLPVHLQSYKAYPLSRLAKAVEQIARTGKPLSKQEHTALMEAYVKTGVPAEELLMDPELSGSFLREFQKRSSSKYSEYRLLQELVRLRKQKALPKAVRTRPRAGNTA